MLTVTIPFPRQFSSPPKPMESALLRARRSRAKKEMLVTSREGDSPRSGLPQAVLDELSVTSLLFEGRWASPRCDSPSGLSQSMLDTLSISGEFWPSVEGSAANLAQVSPDALSAEGGLSQDLLDALCIS